MRNTLKMNVLKQTFGTAQFKESTQALLDELDSEENNQNDKYIPISFTERVWQLCKKVPKGKVTTYGEIAAAMKTRACRAVGNALNKNQSRAVPCHRVVGSDGSLAGFAKGLAAKARLLKKEGIRIRNGKIVAFKRMIHRF